MVIFSQDRAETWRGFLRFCENKHSSQWIYRGVPDSSYELRPTVGRKPIGEREKNKFEKREKNLFELFQKRAELFEDLSNFSLFDALVLAQHHGLPTRLLDWTTSPLVAAFFAIAHDDKHEGKNGRVYAFKTKSKDYVPASMEDKGSPFSLKEIKFYLPRFVSPRIAAQGGLFSIHPEPRGSFDKPELESFDIPCAMKQEFQRRLHTFGINAFKLFPDLDGLARTLAWQYESDIELWHISGL